MGEWDAPHLTPNDAEIMPLIDLSNVACGAHAGSRDIMTKTIEYAIKHNVSVGAHPGYNDRENFGRKYVSLPDSQLEDQISKQLTDFLEVCKELNVEPFHVKAHGAMYHACNHIQREAKVLVNIIKQLCPGLSLFVAPQSTLAKVARAEGLKTMTESFIDRRYNDDLTLVSRSENYAVITKVEHAVVQFVELSEGEITTRNGKQQSLITSTACIHGDNPSCLEILKAIKSDV